MKSIVSNNMGQMEYSFDKTKERELKISLKRITPSALFFKLKENFINKKFTNKSNVKIA